MPSRVRGDTNQEGGDFHEQLATFDNPGKGCTCKKTCKPKLIQSAVLTGSPSSVHTFIQGILILFGILRTISSLCIKRFNNYSNVVKFGKNIGINMEINFTYNVELDLLLLFLCNLGSIYGHFIQFCGSHFVRCCFPTYM